MVCIIRQVLPSDIIIRGEFLSSVLLFSSTAYRVFHLPLMRVILGKPNLLDVSTKASWDDTDSYTIRIRVHNKFFEQVTDDQHCSGCLHKTLVGLMFIQTRLPVNGNQ